MASQAAAGLAALDRQDYSAAITSYTAALVHAPSSPDYYIRRSTAYLRVSPPQYTLALHDAETAVHLAFKRAKRESIAAAQMRRGIALFRLKRFADAARCFDWTGERNEKEQGLEIWKKRVEAELAREGHEGHVAVAAATAVEIPDVDLTQTDAASKEVEKTKDESLGGGTADDTNRTDQAKPVDGVQTPASKIRHEWYQTPDKVVVTLLVKGVPKHQAAIELHEDAVSVSFPMPPASTYDFSLEPLFAPIVASSSSYAVMSTKIELVLVKATPGRKWSSLEGSGTPATGADVGGGGGGEGDAINRPVLASSSTSTATTNTAAPKSTGPVYPTSSRSGPKNWDRVAKELTSKRTSTAASTSTSNSISTSTSTATSANTNNPTSTNDKAREEEDEDDDDDDEGGSDPVNAFFKKLYSGADADTRRAMIKSYQESNGTALSTNWSEVGKGKVETTPPEGMEARSWGE
ncbi:MAG: hypothetical protein M1838_002002 [Thelocarpon superellum]|nr:MAG: hypothetical protein M1838_002002 [Thelocarpon superellum]